jgi:hypothetical protein
MSSTVYDGLVLILATAAISGLLVPAIVNRIQVQNQRRLKTFEAELARQGKIIEEQGEFVTRLSTLLWEYQLAAIAPLYYGQPGMGAAGSAVASPSSSRGPSSDESGFSPFHDARTRYLTDATSLLGAIRAQVGGAVRLVPDRTWLVLRALYYDHLLHVDLRVTRLLLSDPSQVNDRNWAELHSFILDDLATLFDRTIDELSDVLKLKYTETAHVANLHQSK